MLGFVLSFEVFFNDHWDKILFLIWALIFKCFHNFFCIFLRLSKAQSVTIFWKRMKWKLENFMARRGVLRSTSSKFRSAFLLVVKCSMTQPIFVFISPEESWTFFQIFEKDFSFSQKKVDKNWERETLVYVIEPAYLILKPISAYPWTELFFNRKLKLKRL